METAVFVITILGFSLAVITALVKIVITTGKTLQAITGIEDHQKRIDSRLDGNDAAIQSVIMDATRANTRIDSLEKEVSLLWTGKSR